MLKIRKQDPLFINFKPRTAMEAVDRFIRCKNRGLKAHMIPECLIACAQTLDDVETEKFENWIINPDGEIPEAGKLVRSDVNIRNEKIFEQSAREIEQRLLKKQQPRYPITQMMMLNIDDEKTQDDEKMLTPRQATSEPEATPMILDL